MSAPKTIPRVRALDTILGRYKNPSVSLIQILQDIQAEYNYLPEESLEDIAQKLHVPLSHIYSIATFFTAFSLKPKGKHICTVCMGTACHVRGATTILNEFERRLDIKAGENTADMEYTLETVNCLGCCAIAPVVVLDGQYHGVFKLGDISQIIKDR